MGSKTISRSPAFPSVLTRYKLLEIERDELHIAGDPEPRRHRDIVKYFHAGLDCEVERRQFVLESAADAQMEIGNAETIVRPAGNEAAAAHAEERRPLHQIRIAVALVDFAEYAPASRRIVGVLH